MTEEEFIKELQPDRHNADWLYLFWFKPIRKFMIQNVNKNWNGVKMIDLLAKAKVKGRPSKWDMTFICSKIYTNPDILNDYYQTLSKEDQLLIEKATWSPSVDGRQLNEIYGRKVVKAVKNPRGSYDPFTLVIDSVLDGWKSFRNYERYVWNAEDEESYLKSVNFRISLPFMLRKVYSAALPKPEGYELIAINKPGNTTIFSVEELIFRELPLILAYYYQDNLRYTMKGYPNIASARKMERSLGLNKFPSEEETGLRGIIIAGLFSDSFKLASLSEPPLQIFQQLFGINFAVHPTIPYLLPHLKGINRLDYPEIRGDISFDIFKVFLELPLDKWISFGNIQTYIVTHFVSLQSISYYDLDKLELANTLLAPRTHYRVIRDNMADFVDIPLLAGHIYLLAAFGMMEIAVDENIPFTHSYYDGLKAFKLTNLGAYILGLKDTYTPPEIDNETKLLFDENAPLIRIEGNQDLGGTLLDKYAVKVSQNRYQFNPGKFLKDCKTARDVKMKVHFFKETVGKELPEFWNSYLEQLVKNSKTVEHGKNIVPFKLPSNHKELHRLVAQDPVLRSFIIKAEKFYVLIEKNKLNTFKNRMKELGYLVE